MKTSFERFFIEHNNRPLPKEPTHYLVADILNRDLSIKRITVYFNPEDYWINPSEQFGQNNPKAVGKLIGNYLGFISMDKASQFYQYWIVEIATNNVVVEKSSGFFTSKVHYAIDEDKFSRV
ncbi:MAG TPA: hypothetical protein VHE59_10480 [Mucilaginibacter sp.]|nr:hypothetical protein [Mucilaginibacter sp.]